MSDTPAPGAFPSFEDVRSGKAPFPDTIPVYSFDPLIIPPPLPEAAGEASTPMQVQFGSVHINSSSDPSQMKRMLEERDSTNSRKKAWKMVMLAESGTKF